MRADNQDTPPAKPPSRDGINPPGALPRVVRVNRHWVVRSTLLYGLSISLLLVFLGILYFRIESNNNLNLKLAGKERALSLAALSLTESMTGVLSDLRYLSRHNELDDYLRSATPSTARRLELEYAAFLRQKRDYDQIRMIDLDGRERVRVDHAHDGVFVTPASRLQDKASRYYFKDMSKLRPNEIYVSPMDLNIEQGRIEMPPKPVIRVAMAVSDRNGQRKGYVVINILVKPLLQRLRSFTGAKTALWMLDTEGHWLMGPSPNDDWSRQLPERQVNTLPRRYPAAWAEIGKNAAGMLTTDKQHLQYARLFPLRASAVTVDGVHLAQAAAADRYAWILVAATPFAEVEAANARLLRNLLAGGSLLALLFFGLSAALAYVAARGRALSEALEKAVDSVPMLVSYVDTEERYRFNNLAYLRTLGQSPRDLYGKHVREALGDLAYRKILPYLEQALAGKRVEFEQRLDYPGIGRRDVAVTYLPDMDANGQVRGFYAVVNDVTLLKDTQRRESQHMLELAHVSRLASMGEMAAEIAHQINQPLSAIGMFNGAALRNLENGGDQAQVREWLGMIGAQVKRAGEVIGHMRRFVRKGGNQYCELDVNQPATAVASLLEYEAKARQVALNLDLCEPLPPVWADRILIEQVIYNLVRNAIETLAAREQDRRVTIRTHADTEYVWLEVTDNGPGIDQEIGEHIFEAFSTQKQDGLGMGLAISRSIIGSLGGNLGYNNLQEGGVMFYFNLPLENP